MRRKAEKRIEGGGEGTIGEPTPSAGEELGSPGRGLTMPQQRGEEEKFRQNNKRSVERMGCLIVTPRH